MNRRVGTIITAVLVVLAAVTIAGPLGAQEEKGKVGIGFKEGIGNYLVDSGGRTLYSFKNDSPGKSACSGPCAQNWPPYCWKVEELQFGDGLKAADFGAFSREDVGVHTTYKGMPLYRFSGDLKPGDTNGQGVKGLWFAVKP